jgi:hypothetical protein
VRPGAQPDKPAGAAHPVFLLPVFVLSAIRPALGAGFVSKAFHPGASGVARATLGRVCGPGAVRTPVLPDVHLPAPRVLLRVGRHRGAQP